MDLRKSVARIIQSKIHLSHLFNDAFRGLIHVQFTPLNKLPFFKDVLRRQVSKDANEILCECEQFRAAGGMDLRQARIFSNVSHIDIPFEKVVKTGDYVVIHVTRNDYVFLELIRGQQ